jgi:hypothetical protein
MALREVPRKIGRNDGAILPNPLPQALEARVVAERAPVWLYWVDPNQRGTLLRQLYVPQLQLL